ncbi:MAG TPA: hypothetical protein VII95_04640 [Terriglobales bacterium]|jgi:hypothetical protein
MTVEPEVSGQSDVEEYVFSKDKLPKALSYPLKRSLLDAALCLHSVYPTVRYVVYAGRPYENVPLDAHFVPEGCGSVSSGKAWITVHAVPAAERKLTEELLLTVGLPILCRWLAEGQSKGNAWRGLPHSLTLRRVGELWSVLRSNRLNY